MQRAGIPVPGCGDVACAFDKVFSVKTLQFLYGPDVRVDPWKITDDGRRSRRIRGSMQIEGAPAEVMRFLAGGKQLRATTRQDVAPPAADGSLDVTHKVRMHFLGAELVRVQPSFRLHMPADAEGPPLLDAEVRVGALFPPPLGGILEGFMERFSRHQLAMTELVLSR